MRLFVTLVLWIASAFSLQAKPGAWKKLENCTLLENPWNDGDSFHVKANGRERIFRLYFVDCPEIEATYPKRVKEQAKYFAITSERAIRAGELARIYLLSMLRDRTFTVWTRGEDAEGDSRLGRTYALVYLDGKDIGAVLVENGLARVYGRIANLPDGQSAKGYRKKLDALEREARERRRGAWVDSGAD